MTDSTTHFPFRGQFRKCDCASSFLILFKTRGREVFSSDGWPAQRPLIAAASPSLTLYSALKFVLSSLYFSFPYSICPLCRLRLCAAAEAADARAAFATAPAAAFAPSAASAHVIKENCGALNVVQFFGPASQREVSKHGSACHCLAPQRPMLTFFEALSMSSLSPLLFPTHQHLSSFLFSLLQRYFFGKKSFSFVSAIQLTSSLKVESFSSKRLQKNKVFNFIHIALGPIRRRRRRRRRCKVATSSCTRCVSIYFISRSPSASRRMLCCQSGLSGSKNLRSSSNQRLEKQTKESTKFHQLDVDVDDNKRYNL